MPRVVVAAADRRVRDSVSSLLSATGRAEVIGAAGDERTALVLVAARRPEVVVLDRRLVDPGDASLVRSLRERAPGIRILIVQSDGHFEAVLPLEVDGVLDANTLPSALVASLTGEGPSRSSGD